VAPSSDAPRAPRHRPVLYQEVLSALRPRAGGRYIDGTLGAGGHAAGLLAGSSPDGMLLGLDRDPQALEIARLALAEYGDRAHIRHAAYADLGHQADSLGWEEVDGILLDLGLSSMQLDQPERGFAFKEDGPLDMRFDPGQALSARDLVNTWPEGDLADVLFELGEERKAKRIARAIAEARPVSSTGQLAQIVSEAVGRAGGRRHPATKTFQALRMAVNDELGQLEQGLEAAIARLAGGGRVAVISFHSLEDRLVKRYFKRESRDCICPPGQPTCTCGHQASVVLVTRKPIRPGQAEVASNPRARSARLRVAEHVGLA
jgi:16S rRNA (cytosine1402-N4)-methyltransferase